MPKNILPVWGGINNQFLTLTNMELTYNSVLYVDRIRGIGFNNTNHARDGYVKICVQYEDDNDEIIKIYLTTDKILPYAIRQLCELSYHFPYDESLDC